MSDTINPENQPFVTTGQVQTHGNPSESGHIFCRTSWTAVLGVTTLWMSLHVSMDSGI